MDFWVTLTDDRAALIRKASAVVESALYESKMALSEIIDVLPRLSRIKGKFIGSGPNDRA